MTQKAREWMRNNSTRIDARDPLFSEIVDDVVGCLHKGEAVTLMINGELCTIFINRWDEITIARELKP